MYFTYNQGVEAVGKKYRIAVGFIYQMIFTVGSALLGLVAYYVREWKTLQLIVSVPMFAFVGLYWYENPFYYKKLQIVRLHITVS